MNPLTVNPAIVMLDAHRHVEGRGTSRVRRPRHDRAIRAARTALRAAGH